MADKDNDPDNDDNQHNTQVNPRTTHRPRRSTMKTSSPPKFNQWTASQTNRNDEPSGTTPKTTDPTIRTVPPRSSIADWQKLPAEVPATGKADVKQLSKQLTATKFAGHACTMTIDVSHIRTDPETQMRTEETSDAMLIRPVIFKPSDEELGNEVAQPAIAFDLPGALAAKDNELKKAKSRIKKLRETCEMIMDSQDSLITKYEGRCELVRALTQDKDQLRKDNATLQKQLQDLQQNLEVLKGKQQQPVVQRSAEVICETQNRDIIENLSAGRYAIQQRLVSVQKDLRYAQAAANTIEQEAIVAGHEVDVSCPEFVSLYSLTAQHDDLLRQEKHLATQVQVYRNPTVVVEKLEQLKGATNMGLIARREVETSLRFLRQHTPILLDVCRKVKLIPTTDDGTQKLEAQLQKITGSRRRSDVELECYRKLLHLLDDWRGTYLKTRTENQEHLGEKDSESYGVSIDTIPTLEMTAASKPETGLDSHSDPAKASITSPSNAYTNLASSKRGHEHTQSWADESESASEEHKLTQPSETPGMTSLMEQRSLTSDDLLRLKRWGFTREQIIELMIEGATKHWFQAVRPSFALLGTQWMGPSGVTCADAYPLLTFGFSAEDIVELSRWNLLPLFRTYSEGESNIIRAELASGHDPELIACILKDFEVAPKDLPDLLERIFSS